MKKFTYRVQFTILALWVPVVIVIFKLIEDRQLAALIAGVGFIFWPLVFIGHEIFQRNKANRSNIHLLGCLQFLLLFAVPLFLLRVLNWGVSFNELSLLGVPATQLHRFSNMSYLVMILAIVFSSYRERKAKNR